MLKNHDVTDVTKTINIGEPYHPELWIDEKPKLWQQGMNNYNQHSAGRTARERRPDPPQQRLNSTDPTAVESDIALPTIGSFRPETSSRSRLPECLFSAAILMLTAIRANQEYQWFIRTPGSSWNLGEWMIDYSGGFVRRGLAGAVLHSLLHLTGWSIFPVWASITVGLYLALCAWFLSISLRSYAPAIWRFALLFNPALLISVCDFGSITRTDMFFVGGTLLNVCCCRHALKFSFKGNELTQKFPFALVIAAATSTALALTHEGLVLFLWLPLNLAVTGWTVLQRNEDRKYTAILLSVAFAPSLAAIAASVRFHGSVASSVAICRSWRFAFHPICSPGPGFPPTLSTLTWNISQGTSLSLRYAWRFPLYLLLFALTGAVLALAIGRLRGSVRLDHLLVLFLLPFAASLPLYVLGEDWGRWMCLLEMCILPVALSDTLRPALYDCVPQQLSKFVTKRIATPLIPLSQRVSGAIENEWLTFSLALTVLSVPLIPEPELMVLNRVAIVMNLLHQHPFR